tara:strand:+ start:1269 stop:1838 length:570 start_codon:yes stop_codon:yes gene_type:complete
MIFSQFINIYLNVLKINKNYFNNKNNFGEAAIYFAISIVIINSLISIIPNSAFLEFMSSYFGLGKIAGPSLKAAVITSIIGWFIKSCYIHFAGVVLFPNKNTNCNFRKTLILTGLVQSPLIFNFFVFGQIMLPLVFVTYIWYNVCLIVGINVVYNYKSIIKSTLIALAPLILFILYILSNLVRSSATLT